MSKLVQIKIDGQTLKVKEGKNLVDAARDYGIFIPSLCYFEHIHPPLGTCRVCTCKIDGKPTAACLIEAKEGLEVEVNTPELKNLRKAVIEMMFAEGNHFCPGCEKSGDCDLQHMGYELGVSVSRFPHLFRQRIIDFNPKRLVIEQNRCVLCRRCVEEVKTEDGHRVFSFKNRGNRTVVDVDYDQEKKLSEVQARHAMNICPVGAILVRGESLTRPFGERRFDLTSAQTKYSSQEKELEPNHRKKGKRIIATTSLAGCFGCHMSMLDIDTELLDIVELVEFNKSPINDIKKFTKRCDVGIIEGGCCNTDNIEVLRTFREKCDILIAIGECSIWGGLPAMRNTIPLEECLEEAYQVSENGNGQEAIIPYSEDIPMILDRVYACNEIVKIDYNIPGCPPDSHHMWKIIKNILFGEEFSVLYSEFKYD